MKVEGFLLTRSSRLPAASRFLCTGMLSRSTSRRPRQSRCIICDGSPHNRVDQIFLNDSRQSDDSNLGHFEVMTRAAIPSNAGMWMSIRTTVGMSCSANDATRDAQGLPEAGHKKLVDDVAVWRSGAEGQTVEVGAARRLNDQAVPTFPSARGLKPVCFSSPVFGSLASALAAKLTP